MISIRRRKRSTPPSPRGAPADLKRPSRSSTIFSPLPRHDGAQGAPVVSIAAMTSPALHHHARQHRSNMAGVEAVSITSNRRFPRHAHDNYGIGLFDRGAHRSWSSFGDVESGAGDIVTVNPEEMHDGVPLANAPRSWRMIYFERSIIDGHICEEDRKSTRLNF